VSHTDLHSIVSIYGTVQTVDRRCRDEAETSQPCDCRFAIENEDGRFSVQASLLPASCDQLATSRVQVIGTLRSTFFRECHQHHQVIEALLIVILGRTKKGRARVLAVLRSAGEARPEVERWERLISKG
jgi:hypothetical protein